MQNKFLTYKGLILVLALSFVLVGCKALVPPGADNANTNTNNAMMEDNKMKDDDSAMGDDKMMEDDLKTFELDGFNFGYSQTEIRVQEGDRVKIVLTSTDGFHDWVVDEFDAATQRVNTGETTNVEFLADQKGTFEFYCSVGQHRQLGMTGTLIVE